MKFNGVLRRQAKRQYGNPVTHTKTRGLIDLKNEEEEDDDDEDYEDLIDSDVPVLLPYHSKTFLNLPEQYGEAAISIHFEFDQYNIIISDCSKKITLHNCVFGESSKNAFHKIDTIIEELSKLRSHLLAELEEAEEINCEGKETIKIHN